MTPHAETFEDVILCALTHGIKMDAVAAGILAESIVKSASELGLGKSAYYLRAVHPASIAERNEMMRMDYRAGCPVEQIKRRYGVSHMTVYRAIKENASD